eukprot:g3554.t1
MLLRSTLALALLAGAVALHAKDNGHGHKEHPADHKSFAWVEKARAQFPHDQPSKFTKSKYDTGLLYADVDAGSGEVPNRGDTATVRYQAFKLPGGKGAPEHVHSLAENPNGPGWSFSVGTGRTNHGFDEAVWTMKQGGKRVAFVPAKLAFGHPKAKDNKNGFKLAKSDALYYFIELLKIERQGQHTEL